MSSWVCEFASLWIYEFVSSWVCEFASQWVELPCISYMSGCSSCVGITEVTNSYQSIGRLKVKTATWLCKERNKHRHILFSFPLQLLPLKKFYAKTFAYKRRKGTKVLCLKQRKRHVHRWSLWLFNIRIRFLLKLQHQLLRFFQIKV